MELWDKVIDVTGFAVNDKQHKEILRKIFKKGAGK